MMLHHSKLVHYTVNVEDFRGFLAIQDMDTYVHALSSETSTFVWWSLTADIGKHANPYSGKKAWGMHEARMQDKNDRRTQNHHHYH